MNDAAQRRLLDRLRPDTSRTGRVRRILSTTHNLQADFFDGDFLGTALSIAQADFAGHSGQLALQRKLVELEYCGVLCEARGYEQRPSLRTVVHPVTLRGACLHAKLVVIEYEHAVRVLVGSANLTSNGYRENREVLGEHLAHENEPKKAAESVAILREARAVLGAFQERAAEFLAELDRVLTRVAGWARAVAPAISPVVWSDGTRPLWRSFLERWPDGALVERLRIVSPFWCEDGTRDTPLRRLLAELQRRRVLGERCQVELFVESTPLAAGGFAPLPALSFYYPDFPQISVRVIPVDPTVAPTDLDIKADLTALRALHAKVLVLESRDSALAYAGSANFTRNGFALRHAAGANIEAGWVFELSLGAVKGLLPPIASAGQDVPSLERPLDGIGVDEDDLAARFWPDALLTAELTPNLAGDALELSTVWDATTPAGWTIHADQQRDQGERGAPLFTTSGGKASVKTSLTASALETILRQRFVLVASEAGNAEFPVNVAAGEARHALALSAAGMKPGESELTAYYQGKLTFDELYPDPEGSGRNDAQGVDGAQRQGVDKSRIQAYQIRAFVDALPGMRQGLAAARGTQGALFQAFLGEVSPLALATHIAAQVETGTRSVTAGAFQLQELAILLGSLPIPPALEVEHYAETCARARREVEKLLSRLRTQHNDELGEKSAFARYANQLQQVSP